MIKVSGIFIFIILLGLGCGIIKAKQSLFQVKEAYYQSWFKSENEKGTHILIEVSNIKHGVVFDSVIFRGKILPLFIDNEGNALKLKADYVMGIPRISEESKAVSNPDQLLYRYLGKRYIYPINLQRKEMKYFK
jgi:hypothetical protein